MKSVRLIASIVAACGIALTASACGPAAPPADGGSFANVGELKAALVKAGGKCDDWEQHDKSVLAETSGNCGDKFALSVYSDLENRDLWIDTAKKVKANAVAGKNWTISGTEAAEVHKLLGGELIAGK
jgi:hypothetical protein